MRQGTRYIRRAVGPHPAGMEGKPPHSEAFCRKKRWLRRSALTVAAAAALAVGMVRGGILSQGAVFVYDDEEDWEEEEDMRSRLARQEQEQRGSGRETGSSPGPGTAAAETDGTVLTGPYVEQVTLQERYHEEYKVYEESMADLFFFYASVGNGGITHEAVTLDIPQNIRYTMEMDGLPYAYQPGQSIGAYGTYVVRLTGIEDETLPFYEQKEYRAVFRFRIQAKPPEEAEGAGSMAGGGSFGSGTTGGLEWKSYRYDGTPLEESDGQSAGLQSGGDGSGLSGNGGQTADGSGSGGQTAGSPGSGSQAGGGQMTGGAGQAGGGQTADGAVPEGGGQTADGAGGAGQAGDGQTAGSPGGAGQDGTAPADGSALQGDGGEGLLPGQDGSGAADPEGSGGSMGAEGGQGAGRWGTGYQSREQVYDPGAKAYKTTFQDGQTLSANVPEGYMGPEAVELRFQETGEAVLYRDDQPVEYSSGDALTEPGHYRLELDGKPWSFTIASYVDRACFYGAPAGMQFAAASLDGEPLELTSKRYVPMEADGVYRFALESVSGEPAALDVSLTKDTQPPVFEVKVGGGSASVRYQSEDIQEVRLERDGELLEGVSVERIDRPGQYRLTAVDHAGNVASSQFVVRYRVNRYGVFAVVLVLLLLAGGAVFVIHTKRTVKIR